MDPNFIVGILGVLLGIGGGGGVGLAVQAYRAHKKGKIEDDGTLIERLNNENKDLTASKAKTQKFEQLWMTQAFRYRKQIARVPDLEPDDMPQLWGDDGTPKVEETT